MASLDDVAAREYHPRAMLKAEALLLATIFMGCAAIGNGQTAPAATPLNWGADDTTRAADLTGTGERREGKLVVLFTPAGAVDDAEEAALLDRLDRGMAALRQVIGTHSWQWTRPEQKTPFYISPGEFFVPHASPRDGGSVFIPLVRLQDGRAPYLHEAAHVLMPEFAVEIAADVDQLRRLRPTRALWLHEGLADYTSFMAAAQARVSAADALNIGGLVGADAACKEHLRGPRGAEVLPFIGALGGPDGLFTTDRTAVGPAFYACARSYTAHLVKRIGLPAAIALTPLTPSGGVLPRIEQLTGTSMDALRAEWRAAIGVP